MDKIVGFELLRLSKVSDDMYHYTYKDKKTIEFTRDSFDSVVCGLISKANLGILRVYPNGVSPFSCFDPTESVGVISNISIVEEHNDLLILGDITISKHTSRLVDDITSGSVKIYRSFLGNRTSIDTITDVRDIGFYIGE